MNDQQQVTDIFEAALERPLAERDAFLRQVCRDESQYDEVRELLSSFEEDVDFLAGTAVVQIAADIAGESEQLKPGDQLGRYRIRSRLGAGGMGEVFLALDAELNRPVALKILSPLYSGNDEWIRRFAREARAVSALNHPNILTLYEIGTERGIRFLATEYIAGETLRAAGSHPVPLAIGETLDIVAQVAEGLRAAHENGIVHRDIKPENIMLRGDGLVKILDFGLAKPAASVTETYPSDGASAASAHTLTNPGVILGTVAYMSPEQVRGAETDGRADLWSLGVVLYEVVIGRQPFAGETTSDVIAAILKDEPEPFDTGFPDLNRLIKKSLRRNPAERFQTAAEFLGELQTLRRITDSSQLSPKESGTEISGMRQTRQMPHAASSRPSMTRRLLTASHISLKFIQESFSRRRSMAWTLTAILALLSAAMIFGIFNRLGSVARPGAVTVTDTFQTMRIAKLTTTGNIAGGDGIASSSDGNYLAYVVRDKEFRSLWIKPTAAAAAAVEVVPPAKAQFGEIAFSQSGDYLYYSILFAGETAPQLYRMPVRGGTGESEAAQKLLADLDGSIAFSPDGGRVAFVRAGKSLLIADASRVTAPQQLASADEGREWNLVRWSPDGTIIVASAFSAIDNYTYLTAVRAADGSTAPFVSPPWLRVNGIWWLPDQSGLVIAGRDRETAASSQLWLLSYPEGTLRRITNDFNNYIGATLSADGKTIFSVQQELLTSIWAASASSPVSTKSASHTRRITFEQGRGEGLSGVAAAPDGGIIYTVRNGANQSLWTINRDGTSNRQLASSDAASNFSPAVSPDNRYLVFVSSRAGGSDIWRMDAADGGNLRRLTNNPGVSGEPACSPDGNWVVYQQTDLAGATTVWKVSIEGGDSIRLTGRAAAARPVVSPDNETFICNYQDAADGKFKIGVVPLSGGQPLKLLDLPSLVKSRNVRWSRDGRSLIYIDDAGGAGNLWSQPLDNSHPRRLTDFSSEQIFRFDVAAFDGEVVAARGEEHSDIITIGGFR